MVSRELLRKHLRCRSSLDLGWSQNMRAYWLFGSSTRSLKEEGNLSLLALKWISRVSFIKHLRLHIKGMRSDNALPMPVSARLILISRIFPRLVFPGFPYSSKTSTLNSSCKWHLLKPFYILHVTQSRVSMGLTVSRISVKKLAVRRKNWTVLTLSCRKN